MCLTVDKVAPSSDALTDQQTECRQITQTGKRQFLNSTVHRQYNHNTDDRTVNCDAALPDGDDLIRMLAVIAPFKCHIVNTGADDADRHTDDQAVHQIVRRNAELLRPPIDIQRRQHKAQADNNAIPVNILAEQIDGDTVDVKVQAERRK